MFLRCLVRALFHCVDDDVNCSVSILGSIPLFMVMFMSYSYCILLVWTKMLTAMLVFSSGCVCQYLDADFTYNAHFSFGIVF